MTNAIESDRRSAIVHTARALNSTGLTAGASGNVSVRVPEGFLITPSGLAYAEMRAEDVVSMDLQGNILSGRQDPSSEWRFHRDIFAQRADAQAIVHAHSNYATALACVHREIPAFHYMVAIAGGDNIRCAPYATFGTQALSDHALAALSDRTACLLANHGLIALGQDLDSALQRALHLEGLAQQYLLTLQIGEPVILTSEEMSTVVERFKTYGQANRSQ